MFLKCITFLIVCLSVGYSGHLQTDFFCEKLTSNDQRIHKKLKDLTTHNFTDYVGVHRLIQCKSVSEKYLSHDYLSEFEGIAGILEPAANKIQNKKCRSQLNHFVASLRNSSLWAVQMFDASTKIPQGLLHAETFQLGNYDECVEIDLKIKNENVQGKYCLAQLQIIPAQGKYPRFYKERPRDPFSLDYRLTEPAFEKFLIPGIKTRIRKNLYRSAICVPNECTNIDVQEGLRYLYNNVAEKYGFNIHVSVPPNVCSVKGDGKYSLQGNFLYQSLIGMFFWIVIVTILDLITAKSEEGRPYKIFEIFSARRNFIKLTDTGKSQEFPALHTFKFLSLAIIVFGHRVYLTFGGPIINRQKMEEIFHGSANVYYFMLNGPIVVDTFLIITGFLMCYNLYSAFKKNPNLKFRTIYLSRWLRLAPAYMIMVFYYAYVLENIGDGPLWKERIGREAERCRDSWWANLLYLNNYVNLDKICMLQSWYVAVDMHYLLLAPFIIKKLVTAPKKGITLLSTLIGATVAVTFGTVYLNRLPGLLKVDIDLLEDESNNEYYTQVYIKTHTRALPYLLGIGTAYLYLKIKEKGLVISLWQTNVISFIAGILGLWAFCSGSLFQSSEKGYDGFQSATFAVIRPLFWGLSMAWVVLSSSLDLLIYINPFIYKKLFIPLSRLSYPVLLVHGVIQLYINGILRTAEYVTISRMLWMGMADLAATYFFALILHLVIEAPVGIITKILLTPKVQKLEKSD